MTVEEKPATFINRPLSRAQLRRKYMRKINKVDINWKDTAFLAKFMNDTGKILNKYQSRLPSAVHRKVAKTIKRLRDMELVAHVGMLKPTDKIPVGSFIEDMEEMHRKTIDPVTGRMFLKHSLQDELSKKEERIFGRLEHRLKGTETQGEFASDQQAEIKQSIMREMSLESAGAPLIPNKSQRQWMIAQAHIVERNGELEQSAKEAELDGTQYVRPAVEFLGAKETYDHTINKIKKQDPSANQLFDLFLSEKSLNIERVSLQIIEITTSFSLTISPNQMQLSQA